MKKLSILFFFVLALGLTVTSCSKDDSKPQASILGTWNFSTMDGVYNAQPINPGSAEDIWADATCTTGVSYFTFDKGTVLHLGLFMSSNNCELGAIDVTYSVNSNNTLLTVNTPNGTKLYPIIKLTATNLDWREEGTSQGISYNIVHHMVKR